MQTKKLTQLDLAKSIVSDTIIFYRTMQGIQMSVHAANPGDTILLDSEMNYNGLNNAFLALGINEENMIIPKLIDKFYCLVEEKKTSKSSELSQLILYHWKSILNNPINNL